MTLNASGPISLAGTTAGQSIEIELGGSGSTTISLNDTNVRTLAGVPSGQIIMPTNFYGKANTVPLSLTISANTQNYNIKTALGASYVSGRSAVTVTINAGIVVGSSSTATYGMQTGTGWSGSDSISIVNNGYIVGRGGNSYQTGGPALALNWPVTITNASGYIYSGGGGGFSVQQSYTTVGHTSGGTPIMNYLNGFGGGGGAGNNVGAGTSGGPAVNTHPGSSGSLTNGGSGGNGSAGGTLGNPAPSGNLGGGGGGGNGAGGANAGIAITRNSNTVTFVSGNTRVYGGIV